MSCFNCCKSNEKSTFNLGNDKKVTFDNKVKVFYFKKVPIENDISWQQVARDRLRFKRRCLNIEQCIGWIWNIDHREKIYVERFCK